MSAALHRCCDPFTLSKALSHIFDRLPWFNPTFVLRVNEPRTPRIPWILLLLELQVKFADDLGQDLGDLQKTNIAANAGSRAATELRVRRLMSA